MNKIPEEHLKILRKYFPEKAIPVVSLWLTTYGIHLSISRSRASKHGDFTSEKVDGMYRISVNGSLSPYAFLLTFVHEVAHLVTHQKYGHSISAHGQEWKNEFRTLMLGLDLRSIYPQDILTPLADYLKNPKASSDRHSGLSVALRSYDQWGNKILVREDGIKLISELQAGQKFYFKESEFELKEKRRRLYLCREIKTGKQYLFQPHVNVKTIK